MKDDDCEKVAVSQDKHFLPFSRTFALLFATTPASAEGQQGGALL